MKSKEELQVAYGSLCTQLGQLEYDFALKKNYILVQLDGLNKEFNDIVKAEQAEAPVSAEENKVE